MANTLIPIQTITLSGTTTSITFSNIPQNYTDLKFVMSIRSTDSNTNYAPIGVQVNGAAPGNLYKSIAGSGASTVNYGTSNDTFTASTAGGSWARISSSGVQAGATTAAVFSNSELYIPNYTSSTTKSFFLDVVTENNSTTAYAELTAGTLTSSSAITSFAFANRDGSWAANSTITLYGISNGVKATGGTLTVAGGYAYHTFTSTGSFLPSQKITGAEVLCIAGGGAGGAPDGWYGGGGGAGGLLFANSQTLTAGNLYTALIGAGGSGSSSGGTNGGNNGSNSQFASLTAIGGGGGGNAQNAAGSNGGSGGGGVRNNGAGGTATSGQGSDGGAAASAGGGGGGGGAGGVGSGGNTTSPTNYAGGPGGVGSSTYSLWGATTGTGQLVGGVYYYAGGGGGCGANTILVDGGLGGGGKGAGWQTNNTGATSGTANTGGGGGGVVGGNQSPYSGASGAGGSGLIIIRYPLS